MRDAGSAPCRPIAYRTCASLSCPIAARKYANRPSSRVSAARMNSAGSDGFLPRSACQTGSTAGPPGSRIAPSRMRSAGAAIASAAACFRAISPARVGMRGQPGARLVVEREQPGIEQRRRARPQDRRHQRLGPGASREHGLEPERRGQRQWHRVLRVYDRRLLEVGGQREQHEVALGLDGRRHVVNPPNDFDQEVSAIGRRAVTGDAERLLESAGDRQVVQCAGRRPGLGVHLAREDQQSDRGRRKRGNESGAQHGPLRLNARGQHRAAIGHAERR